MKDGGILWVGICFPVLNADILLQSLGVTHGQKRPLLCDLVED